MTATNRGERSVSHPVFARFYNRLSRQIEAKGSGEHRAQLLEGLTGRVIELGAGNGLNFAYYPATVTEVVAVEQAGARRASAAAIGPGVATVRRQ